MNIHLLAAATKVGLAILLTHGVAAEAAEVRLIAVPAISAVIGELGPQFEHATGHKLVTQYGVTGVTKQRIETGEVFDLAIGPAPLMDDLIKQGKIAGATRTGIARVGHGVGVRAGAPKPDISSADAFKRALLNAKSVTYILEGSTGAHLARVLERLGITEQMKAKTQPQQVPERIGQAVAAGEAELGFVTTNIMVTFPGVELVGPFPPGLQNDMVLTAGVGTAAIQPDAAKALIKLLRGPEAAAVIKAKGLELIAP